MKHAEDSDHDEKKGMRDHCCKGYDNCWNCVEVLSYLSLLLTLSRCPTNPVADENTEKISVDTEELPP